MVVARDLVGLLAGRRRVALAVVVSAAVGGVAHRAVLVEDTLVAEMGGLGRQHPPVYLGVQLELLLLLLHHHHLLGAAPAVGRVA